VSGASGNVEYLPDRQSGEPEQLDPWHDPTYFVIHAVAYVDPQYAREIVVEINGTLPGVIASFREPPAKTLRFQDDDDTEINIYYAARSRPAALQIEGIRGVRRFSSGTVRS